MKNLEYKGYVGSVEASTEDNVLHGRLLHIRDLVTYEADTVPELRKAFESAVDDYLTDCARDGTKPDTPFKGAFNVRIPPELHRRLALQAECEQRSLNDLVGHVLQEHFNERARRPELERYTAHIESYLAAFEGTHHLWRDTNRKVASAPFSSSKSSPVVERRWSAPHTKNFVQ